VSAFLLSAALTIAAAWPVVGSPAHLIYGHEIAGRHPDAYTVMLQIAGASTSGPYAQPVTDRLGWLFARIWPPVAAYNLLVLLSFPLTAAVTYVLARRLTASHAAALIASVAFTFAPIRLAHAAYHPHIVQTQWVALYFLALLALVDRWSPLRATFAALTCGAMVLSNYYAGLIGAVLTPVAIVAYWAIKPDDERRPRALVLAAITMAGIAATGIVAIAWIEPQIWREPSPFGYVLGDVGRYSARWWAYFLPPVDQPLAGARAAAVLASAGERVSIVEEQVSMSWALLVLASIAIVTAIRQWRREPRRRPVLAIVAVGAAAWAVSLGPSGGTCTDGSWALACTIYRVAPMFRAYARFALVAHLALAIAAGAGAVILARGFRAGRVVAAVLLTIAAIEYWPWPARAHDVLPTAGHRWLADAPDARSIFDCAPFDGSTGTLTWLMQKPVAFAATPNDCADPGLGDRLALSQTTHVVARTGSADWPLPASSPRLALVASFPDSRVYTVAPGAPAIVTERIDGLDAFEHDGAGTWWRWMGRESRWSIRNLTAETRRASLTIRARAADGPRALVITLDGIPAGHVEVGTDDQDIDLPAVTLTPGPHTLVLTAIGELVSPAARHHSSDTRELSVMLISAQWMR
jgi:hypothetical protein